MFDRAEYDYLMAKRLPTGLVQFLIDHPDGAHDADLGLMCGGCKTTQPVSEFYLAGAMRSKAAGRRLVGNVTRCRSCAKAYADRRKAPLQKIINALKAGGCVDCGLVNREHPVVFDFDHIGDDKVKGVSHWLTSGTEADLRAEAARCEVVCANCHRIRTQTRPHGSRGKDERKPSHPMKKQV